MFKENLINTDFDLIKNLKRIENDLRSQSSISSYADERNGLLVRINDNLSELNSNLANINDALEDIADKLRKKC